MLPQLKTLCSSGSWRFSAIKIRLKAIGFWTFSALIVTAVAILVLWKLSQTPNFGQNDTFPAWIQAIGSIIAITWSLWAANYQAKTAYKAVERSQALSLEAKSKSIVAIVKAARSIAGKVRLASLSEDSYTQLPDVYNSSVVNAIVRALQNIPAHEVGSSDGVLELLSLPDQFVLLGGAIGDYLSRPKDREVQIQLIDLHVENIMNKCNNLINSVQSVATNQ